MDSIRQYAAPLMLAVLLHAGAGAALVRTWGFQADEPRQVAPRIIHSELLVLAEKPPPPAPTPAPPPQRTEPAEPDREPDPPAPPAEPEKPSVDSEAAQRAQEAERRQQRLLEMFEESTALAFQEEVDSREQAETDALTNTYAQAIGRAIMENWSRPPSARNNMQARFLMELTPSGDLLSLTLTESSGNAPFDRSAQAAVRKVGRFRVPNDRRLFEAHFRRFQLLFKPEDLLR